ncbi:MAG: 4Fe-4S ferredoxin [Deltaproteobacteria bacterium]|nr:4Fe-4S ferredoxin [Deltaproteobacteria bacterium]MBW2658210.1 4Fe-4S ferredoxin [Deltaproteobacteria bacterium]
MKALRKIIQIDEELCDGCGQCVPDCAEGSLKIIDGKAKLVADKLCDGLGACLGSCPTGALKIIERKADEFDEEAVEVFLAEEKRNTEEKSVETMDCGCASTHIQSFKPEAAKSQTSCQTANIPINIPAAASTGSMLTHWPVQIRLVPAHAPFLKNSDLLVAADCTAVTVKDFQQKYLDGKTVLMGCPKFDDAESYVQRFAEIIESCDLKSLTILIMEVPCCSAMNIIIKKAVEKAGVSVPIEQITISTRGEELERKSW